MAAIKATAPMTGPAIQALLEGAGVLNCVAAGVVAVAVDV